jgi:hypothetical protein
MQRLDTQAADRSWLLLAWYGSDISVLDGRGRGRRLKGKEALLTRIQRMVPEGLEVWQRQTMSLGLVVTMDFGLLMLECMVAN